MPGIFKQLNAQDIKITPFEAHKEYNTVDLGSIGASTESIAWSGANKSEFTTGSRLYYQIDKLYYRNYIRERAYRLELDSATYTTQERRLYGSASVLSLSQKTFGSGIQPLSFELSGSRSSSAGTQQYHFKDDGFGNLYDVNIGNVNFPNEDNRVLYLAPVNGFKRKDLTVDYETGNSYVNTPYSGGYSRTVYDDSYFLNKVTFEKIKFEDTNLGGTRITRFDENDSDISRITIANRPHLNFNDEDFCISFYYDALNDTATYSSAVSVGTTSYILTKEGAQNSPPLGTEAGGYNSLNTSGALDITTTPANPAYPYRVYCKIPASGKIHVYLERFDGVTTSLVSGSFYNIGDFGLSTHLLLQKTGSKLQVYKNGVLENEEDDLTTKPCQNKADLLLFDKRNNDGSYYDGPDTWGTAFKPYQFQIWNRAMNTNEIAMISQSVTGTYPVGNLFYDNGFAVITHPSHNEVFEPHPDNSLNTLIYKNTHLITENEYQCTMKENEFEFTTNPTARKITNIDGEEIADFATGSAFKPYVTTIGLHDEQGNLLVVGKLAQPIRASSETDTTFVIRFDT